MVLDLARSWYISQEEQAGYDWYNFLGHEYSFFNAIVSHLITLKSLKNQKYLPHESSPGLCS